MSPSLPAAHTMARGRACPGPQVKRGEAWPDMDFWHSDCGCRSDHHHKHRHHDDFGHDWDDHHGKRHHFDRKHGFKHHCDDHRGFDHDKKCCSGHSFKKHRVDHGFHERHFFDHDCGKSRFDHDFDKHSDCGRKRCCDHDFDKHHFDRKHWCDWDDDWDRDGGCHDCGHHSCCAKCGRCRRHCRCRRHDGCRKPIQCVHPVIVHGHCGAKRFIFI